MGKMLLNVIHRAEPGPVKLEALQFQQETARKYGLKTTLLLTYPSMLDDKVVEYVREEHTKRNVEIGISFHDLMCREMRELADSREPALYLHYRDSKIKIINRMFSKFEELFGFKPAVVAGYVVDAWTLKFIKQQYPSVKIAVTNCFEEGVKMFHGNNHWWYLFNDGGPWGSYYPSRDCQLIPAADANDAIGIVGVPHLNRDMVLALTSRDDYFASHPLNVYRAKANIGPESPYMYKFIDKWIEQAEYNGYSYYNTFVSIQWITEGSMFIDSVPDAREMYARNLAYLRQKVDEGKVETMTMEEFADWFVANVKIGQPEVNLWDDMLCGTKRQTFWYIDPYFRVAIDMNLGGTIVDLRAYDAHLNRDLGPDTEALWNGNYPYILSREHRAMANHECLVSYNGRGTTIQSRRTKAKVVRNAQGKHELHVNPIKLKAGELEVTLQSVFTFPGDGTILIERRILDLSDPGARVIVTEFQRGCWGTTIYPEDMRDIEFELADKSGGIREFLSYAYRSRSREIEDPLYVKAIVPQVKTQVQLIAVDKADKGGFGEGHLFYPYFDLRMSKTIGKGEAFRTCLKIGKA